MITSTQYLEAQMEFYVRARNRAYKYLTLWVVIGLLAALWAADGATWSILIYWVAFFSMITQVGQAMSYHRKIRGLKYGR